MIHFIFASEFVKVLIPYIRRYLLAALEPIECLLLNSVVVMMLAIFYLVYRIAFHGHNLKHTFNKISNLTLAQYVFAAIIGLTTVLSSMLILTMDKHFNNPLVNSVLFKFVSIVLLFTAVVVVFKEEYNYMQIIGLFMVIAGGFLIFSGHKGFNVFKLNGTSKN
jgi:drug/metabolite transporter (DMT)-like permease